MHITSMHISFGNLYAYKLSYAVIVTTTSCFVHVYNEDESCYKSKSMCMVATMTEKNKDINMMFCTFSFILFLYKPDFIVGS